MYIFVQKYHIKQKVMKKIILFAFSLLSLVSCKNDDKKLQESKENVAEKVMDTVFTITLNATVKKDDSFQLYYRKQTETTYEETSSFFVEFKGSDKPQDIVFRLPDGVIPDNIRLDFGTNKEQSEIKINSFKMSYFGKTFETNGSDFFNYLLVETKTATFDKDKATLKPLLVNGTYDPQATSEKALFEQIQKIIK